jgi:D-alanyl-D-alanine carboxypeptidase
MIVGVWAPDRNLEWVVGKGKANLTTGQEPDPSMKYRIGSLTKTYTYSVLLQLVDEGHISLSDKISTYLPDFPKADSITVKMICNHTSGIPDFTETIPFQINLMLDPLYIWTIADLMYLIKDEPFSFTPGTEFKYSNTNTIVAGMIVEQITGNSIKTEIQNRILDRLELANTSYPSDTAIIGSFSHGYDFGWGSDPNVLTDLSQWYDPSIAGAAGAMISDVYDLKKWVEHLYKGTLLKRKTQELRLTTIPAPGEDCEEYGLGIMYKLHPPMWGHTGTIPGYKNYAGYCPSENITLVINYNTTSEKPMVLVNRLMEIYLKAIRE